MQIKTAIRYTLIPGTMATIENTNNNNYQRRFGGKGTVHTIGLNVS